MARHASIAVSRALLIALVYCLSSAAPTVLSSASVYSSHWCLAVLVAPLGTSTSHLVIIAESPLSA